jgi:putative tricarboxylic transport membrane protein
MTVWRWLAPRLPSAALLALGLAGLYEASSLTFGTVHQPGSGFFPTVVCVLIVVFSGLALAEPHARGQAAEDADGARGAHARLWLVVGSLFVYVWLLKPIGFLVATVALLLLLLRGIGGARWAVSAPAALVGSAACYWGFTRLGVPLPAGVLGF